MENASKALIMAAEILIGIIVLTLFVYVIVNFSEFSQNFDDKMLQQEIIEYNSKFEVYERKSEILVQDIVSLRNMVQKNNLDYNDTEYEYIKIRIVTDKTNLLSNEYKAIDKLKDNQIFSLIELCNNRKIKFNIKEMKKNKVGKINLIEFEAIFESE